MKVVVEYRNDGTLPLGITFPFIDKKNWKSCFAEEEFDVKIYRYFFLRTGIIYGYSI